jgi:uncharacterized spore protein YtfJ
MAAPPKTPPTKLTGVVHALLDGLHSMSKSETIIGEPYKLGEATLVPIHRLRVAIGAGALQGGARRDASSGESGGLGAGGAVQIEPVAVIAVGRDGVPRFMSVESEPDAAEKIIRQLPELLGNATRVLSDRVGPIVSKFLSRTAPEMAAAAKEALPDTATSLLESKTEASE